MLTFSDVTKKYGDRVAVDHLTLEIMPGKVFGLLGPNGAGKTTMLRMVTGLLTPSSGRIQLFGNLVPGNAATRPLIGYMPQALALYPTLTVRENVEFFGHLYGLSGSQLQSETKRLLNLVELGGRADARIEELSGGMARRAMLASVLIHRPKLVILDEPTAGVDPLLRIRFWDWFDELVKQGTSIIVTTHHISEASRCGDVVFLRNGRIVAHGTPKVLMQQYATTDLEDAFVAAVQRDAGSEL